MAQAEPIILTDTFQEVGLRYSLGLAFSATYIKTEERDILLVAVFNSGLKIAWQSECDRLHDGEYSEEDPDLEWLPPTVWARITR